MHLSLTPDLSVYQLALDNLAPSQSLRVSSTILKSLVEAVLDVLIEEKISATLWVKLPPFEDWQAKLKRYQQQVSVPQTIYLCSCVGDELEQTTETVDANEHSQIFPVQLAAGGQLKREYFVIILSKPFNKLIVASRPEPATATGHPSQPLLAVCTFEYPVIQQVLEGIKGVIAVADTTPGELLECWEALKDDDEQKNSTISIRHSPLHFNEKTLLTQLLVKQVQRMEEMLHSPTTSEVQGGSDLMPNAPVDALGSTSPAITNVDDTATAIFPPRGDDLYNREEFLKRIVQELRTPLTNMKTALKLLDTAQLKPAQRQRYMQLLNRECDRQNSLISGLLDLVQLESEPQLTGMPSVQLADIVPGIVSTYQPIAQEKGIQLGYTMPSGLPAVPCLEAWLRVIFINLVNNSLKFTPAGGQVRVKVTLQGEYIQLAFNDTGIGIAPNEIPKIFDSFYRGRATTGDNTGAGLGLTLVQQLLLRCGGSISVSSRLGEGSSFKVMLPVAYPMSTTYKS